MAIIGVGTDIVELVRIDELTEKYPERFAERLLHENELKQFHKSTKKANFLAKRFSAKEAYSKALGTGIAHGVVFPDIEISHTEKGQPILLIHGKALEKEKELGVIGRHLSISDERHYATSVVVLES